MTDRNCPKTPHFALDCPSDEPLDSRNWHLPDDEVAPERACGACGEREGSSYAKRCCTPDNMVEL